MRFPIRLSIRRPFYAGMKDKTMPYDSASTLCRRCLEKEIDIRELREYLDGYVRELPEDIRIDEAGYQSRLSLCEDCAHRRSFTCMHCGCYIQARAAKRRQRCPLGRW